MREENYTFNYMTENSEMWQSKNNGNVIPEFDLETFQLKAHMHFLTLNEQKFLNDLKMPQQMEEKKKTKPVLAPADVPNNGVVVPVNRQARRYTLETCICLDGSSLPLYLITSRKTVSLGLIGSGYKPNLIKIVHQENGFIDSELFYHWATTIFFPYLVNKRKETGYDQQAILLCDGCTSHFSDAFLDDCVYYGVELIVEPAGSSDQVQALDLGIFGIQKSIKSGLKNNYDLDTQSNEIRKIYNSWQKAALPDNIVSAFQQAGIDKKYTKKLGWFTTVDISNARAVRGVEHEKPEPQDWKKMTIPIE